MRRATAFYGRVIPPQPTLPPRPDHDTATYEQTSSTCPAVLPETRFYRVVHESKLYSIDFGGVCSDVTTTYATTAACSLHQECLSSRDVERDNDDDRVVRIQELVQTGHGRTASARTRHEMMLQDSNGEFIGRPIGRQEEPARQMTGEGGSSCIVVLTTCFRACSLHVLCMFFYTNHLM